MHKLSALWTLTTQTAIVRKLHQARAANVVLAVLVVVANVVVTPGLTADGACISISCLFDRLFHGQKLRLLHLSKSLLRGRAAARGAAARGSAFA